MDVAPSKKHITPIAMKWEEIHPQVKSLLMSPTNQPVTYDENAYACGCSQNKTISRDWWVMLCTYHLGWQDALDSTTGYRIIGAGR